MIIKILKGILGLAIVVLLSLAIFLFYMRYHDGPLEIISGGPFQSGTMVTEANGSELELASIADRVTIEFQLEQPPRSRTVWLAVQDNKLYVASAYMNEGYAKIWKQWPHQAADDNRILLRVDGKIYPRKLVRIFDSSIAATVSPEMERKYGMQISAGDIESASVWLYEVVMR